MTSQIILIALGVVIVALLLARGTPTRFRTRLRTGKEKIVGICGAALGLDAKKRENKEKILTLLRKGSASAQGSGETRKLSNSQIREALGVSDRSVIRYMDELEREGKVEQVGNTGRGVLYRLR